MQKKGRAPGRTSLKGCWPCTSLVHGRISGALSYTELIESNPLQLELDRKYVLKLVIYGGTYYLLSYFCTVYSGWYYNFVLYHFFKFMYCVTFHVICVQWPIAKHTVKESLSIQLKYEMNVTYWINIVEVLSPICGKHTYRYARRHRLFLSRQVWRNWTAGRRSFSPWTVASLQETEKKNVTISMFHANYTFLWPLKLYL